MRIKIMKKGEKFMGIWQDRIVLVNESGEGRLIKVSTDEDGIRVIPEDEISITYGDGTIEVGDLDDGIMMMTF